MTISSLGQNLLLTLGCLAALMIGLWLFSLIRRDASIVDPFWGTGFVIVSWLAVGWNHAIDGRSLLLLALTNLWGLRLSAYLLLRNRRHGEDRRYAVMRAYWGQRFAWISLFTVFLLQGLILWFVSFPLQAAMTSAPVELQWYDCFGMALWCAGFAFESIGDWQLARFKAHPANEGRVMDRGLWKYTRHPNYFGDFCVWWGMYLLAVPVGAWWTIGSPMLMSILLTRVSGVTLLEGTIGNRRPEYADYQARTSSFFPWPPRQSPHLADAPYDH